MLWYGEENGGGGGEETEVEVERGGGDRAFDGYGGGRVTGVKNPSSR